MYLCCLGLCCAMFSFILIISSILNYLVQSIGKYQNKFLLWYFRVNYRVLQSTEMNKKNWHEMGQSFLCLSIINLFQESVPLYFNHECYDITKERVGINILWGSHSKQLEKIILWNSFSNEHKAKQKSRIFFTEYMS